MKKKSLLLLLTILCIGCQSIDYTHFVNPFIGTQDDGHCSPSATTPMGMVQAGPESTTEYYEGYILNHVTGYQYDDPYLYGFTQTRLNGVGCPSMSDILIMPYSGREISSNSRWDYKSTYDKKREVASPGFYSTYLIDNNVKVDITTTPRVAFYRCTFDHNSSAKMVVDLQYGTGHQFDAYKMNIAEAWQESDSMSISGYRKPIHWCPRDQYYTIRFSHKIANISEIECEDQREKAPRYLIEFDLEEGDILQTYIALSTTSVDAAKENLRCEISPNESFESVHDRARGMWNNILGRIEVEGNSDQLTMFYTSLYHTYIQPNNITDTDGKYRSAQGNVRQSRSGNFYSTLSLWDTYRATHPLYTIITPTLASHFNSSIMEHYTAMKEEGVEPYYLPRWALWGHETNTMIANHAISVLADSWLKGIKPLGYSDQEMWDAIWHTLSTSHYRNHIELIDKYGYIPYDDKIGKYDDNKECVSRLLEGAFNDYCAALIADQMGGKDKESEYLWNRASFYHNVYHRESGFMRGRSKDGEFKKDVDVNEVNGEWVDESDFTEANSWHYLFHVQHDVEGMIEMMGTEGAFADKLDGMFYSDEKFPYVNFPGWILYGMVGQYWHGNEPCHHIPYLYKFTDEGYKTDAIINFLTSEFYINAADGLKGNDDCGQMSAWYMFAMMGFYPVNPCSEVLVLGAPQLPKTTIHLDNGSTLEIIANNLSNDNIFVSSATFNGRTIKDNSITYDEIMGGGKLIFEMESRDDREELQNFNIKE